MLTPSQTKLTPVPPASLEGASAPACIPLAEAEGKPVGGKAAGLARLLRAGLDVPSGFVVVGATPGSLPADLAESYWSLAGGGRVAVRSSALAEDGAHASYAGQFVTVLDVSGEAALRQAMERCLASLKDARAEAYRAQREQGAEPSRMCVVVQAMVEARAAGVLFTADPLTGRRDRLVVDAVRGCGEALVSGTAHPDHYQLTPAGEIVRRDLCGEQAILSDGELRALLAGAQKAGAHFGAPLDMEWAIGQDGHVFWLQARPITALPGDPHEFDSPAVPGDLYTTGNIGECMPGPVTPLSWNTIWVANDHGVQAMLFNSGARDRPPTGYRTTRLYLGHIFFDLTEMAQIGRYVLGASDESLGLALCGRVVPDLRTGKKKPLWSRVANTLRYVRQIFSGARLADQLEQMVASFSFGEHDRAEAQLAAIDERLPKLITACDWHIASSSFSGALLPALMQTLSKGKLPTEEHHAQAAALLASVSEKDVESADVVGGVDRLVELLATAPEAEARFAKVSPGDALRWLRGEAGPEVARELEGFLARHGHHCLREFELREKEWAEDPTPFVASLQVALRGRLARPASAGRRAAIEAPRASRGLLWLAKMAQRGVRQRERTKSLLVKLVVAFKRAYRRLGDLLVKEGRLPEADLVFFLTPPELGRLARGEGAGLPEQAAARRRAVAFQDTLRFPDVFTGSPEPLGASAAPTGAGVLHGKPVSRGKVVGPARVALTLVEAAALQPGEILISPVTDIGWSPYFSVIAGLATDVGSSISHGAVVAREYGLPAVVDLHVATRTFKTGDVVELDGDHGTLRLAD